MIHTAGRCTAALAVAALGLAGCDFPTAPPLWTTEWALPGPAIEVGVESFLPEAVRVSDDGAAFAVSLDGADFARTLAQMCGVACAGAPGATIPKPAFSDSVVHPIPLPDDVVSIQLAGGGADYDVRNELTFDPIRPAGATTGGRVRLRVLSGATAIGEALADGADRTWPPETSVAGPFTFAPVLVDEDIGVEFLLDSPQGDPITLGDGDSILVSVSAGDVLVSAVTVNLSPEEVNSSHPLEFDLDEDMLERVHGGSVVLRIRNDFAAGGSFRLQVTGDNIAPAIADKMFTVSQGESVQSIAFARSELRSMLGDPTTTLTMAGSISAPGNQLTVTPGMALRVQPELRLVLGYREEN